MLLTHLATYPPCGPIPPICVGGGPPPPTPPSSPPFQTASSSLNSLDLRINFDGIFFSFFFFFKWCSIVGRGWYGSLHKWIKLGETQSFYFLLIKDHTWVPKWSTCSTGFLTSSRTLGRSRSRAPSPWAPSPRSACPRWWSPSRSRSSPVALRDGGGGGFISQKCG